MAKGNNLYQVLVTYRDMHTECIYETTKKSKAEKKAVDFLDLGNPDVLTVAVAGHENPRGRHGKRSERFADDS